jgi:rhodanese-related sulfurtransferase
MGIDLRLQQARERLARLSPDDAATRVAEGAVLVDIRPERQRRAEGEVPTAYVVERNVLEWRFDPSSEAALPFASADLEVIVLCQEGYTSSLAAEALLDLGIGRATDVAGGFAAWRDAGLPWSSTVSPTVDQKLVCDGAGHGDDDA